eukprot:g5472.t1
MLCGTFGNKRGRSSIVVQSLDGELTFFEDENTCSLCAFQRHLIAGPLVYIEETGALVTSTSAFEIIAYSHPSLKDKAIASNQEQGKQDHLLWKLVIGEVAVSLTEGHLAAPTTENQPVIVVLGEKSLFYISPNGILLSQKRLGFTPLALLVYPVPSHQPPPKQSKLLISTQSGNLMVFDQTRLIWSAKCQTTPVALQLTNLQNIEGMIVALDDKGHLACCFLGTQPNSSLPFLSEESNTGQEEIVKECRLLKKQLQDERFREEADTLENPLDFSLEIQEEQETEMEQSCLKILVHVFCQNSESVLDCDLVFSPPRSLTIDEDSWTVPVIESREENKISIPLKFFKAPEIPTGSKNCTVLVTYTDQNQNKRVCNWSIELPFFLFYKIVPPVKEASKIVCLREGHKDLYGGFLEHKFVLETNQNAVSLRDLFGDLLEYSKFQHVLESSVLTFEDNSNTRVTIIVSKSGGRYRVQSDSIEAMPLLINELETRLKLHQSSSQSDKELSSLVIHFKDALPLEEYFLSVQEYITTREEFIETEKNLENQIVLYRATQKRLITKYKDPKPGNIEPLCFLLQKTLDKIMSSSEGIDDIRSRLSVTSTRLTSATDLVITLLKYFVTFSSMCTLHVLLSRLKANLTSIDVATLRKLLGTEDMVQTEIEWEERMNENIAYALTACLGTEKSGQILKSSLSRTHNKVVRLQEQIKELLHRIEEQGHLLPKPNPPKNKSTPKPRT